MMKFGAPLVARTGAAGQLGAVFFLALGLFVACGNDLPELPGGGNAGTGARAGSPGRAGAGGEDEELAGAAGSSGDAGMVEPGAGGSSGKGGAGGKGGTSGTGGTGGIVSTAGSSGKGGTGGTGPVCGNNVLETGEACDDGNTKFGDSCSPTCTNVCETCEKNVCGAPDTETTGDYAACFGDGFSAGADTAKEGPAVGTKKNVLCPSLLACLKRTGCAQFDQAAILTKCYCGTVSATDCQEPGKPNGPCREEIAAAGESREFFKLTQRVLNPQWASGVASRLYGLCEAGICANECVLGKSSSECQKCAAIADPAIFAACYVNPKGDPKLSAELSSAAVECAHRTGCALNGPASCYGVVTGSGPSSVLSVPGPCATEITAAGKGAPPYEISSELQNPSGSGATPLAAVSAELFLELGLCKATCFPAGGGQGGNSGAGGTSGTGGGAIGGTGG